MKSQRSSNSAPLAKVASGRKVRLEVVRRALILTGSVIIGAAFYLAITLQPAHSGPSVGSFANMVEALSPAVVNISTEREVDVSDRNLFRGPREGSEFDDLFKEWFEERQRDVRPARRAATLGSGFIIDASGTVVTNNHVVGDAVLITVGMSDGRSFEAEVVGRDEQTDIAVLKLKTDETFDYVNLGDSDAVRVGDWVIAIGNPFGFGGTVTAGIVSGRNRQFAEGSAYADYIQTDAPINRGNSGGPLFGTSGDVIGMNTAIYSTSGDSVGIGFSIPSNIVSAIVGQIMEFGEAQRGWLGVRVQIVSSEIAQSLGLDQPQGALVTNVVPESPADKAGVAPGDLILTFDGQDIKSMQDLPRIVGGTDIGSEVKMVVIRKDRRRTLKVTVERLGSDKLAEAIVEDEPDTGTTVQEPEFALGMALSELTPVLREQYSIDDGVRGLLVMDVDPAGPSADVMRPGDVIVELNQEVVRTASSLAKRVERATAAEEGRPNLLLIHRDGAKTFVTVGN